MMDYYWHMPWYGMVLGPIMMIAVLAAIITVVVLLVRWLGVSSTSRPYSAPEKTPFDILKERFARGEIDKQEFEEKSRILSRLP